MDSSTTNVPIPGIFGLLAGLIPSGFLYRTNRKEAEDRRNDRDAEISERQQIRADDAAAKAAETGAERERRLADEKSARIAIVREEVLDFLAATRQLANRIVAASRVGRHLYLPTADEISAINRTAEALLIRVAADPLVAPQVEEVRDRLNDLLNEQGSEELQAPHAAFVAAHATARRTLVGLLSDMENS